MHTPTKTKEIENEILWKNHFITIGGKAIFYRQRYNAGVKTVSDVKDEEGNFLSFPEFRKKRKIKTNFLLYFRLCNAIAKCWKEAFNRTLKTNPLLQDSPQHTL